VAAGRDTISQIVLVWIVTTAIGFSGLHHVILGAVEVFAGAFSGGGIGLVDVSRFLLWATLGNTLGGVVFVGCLKYGHTDSDRRMGVIFDRKGGVTRGG
jgi:formate-nitrite transporter family protein